MRNRWAVGHDPRIHAALAEYLERRLLLANITWTGLAGDNQWTTPGNWSDDALPGSGDNVTINLAGNPTIQLASGTQSVNSVTSTDPLNITGGTLQVGTSLQSSANITLGGGMIQDATVSETSSGALVLGSGTLSGVTIAVGTTALTTGYGTIDVIDGLTLDGTIDLGAADGSFYNTLVFAGTQSLSGSGTVGLGGSAQNTIEAQGSNNGSTSATLTIESGITITGGAGQIDGYFLADSITNDGTINADIPGGTITVGSSQTGLLTNNGTLEATAGTLNVGFRTLTNGDSPWVNNGTLSLLGAGTLSLQGTFTPGDIGNFSRPGDLGTVELAGFLNNTGTTLALNASTGSWELAGATITGGMITDTPGNLLVLTSLNGNGSVLSGITIPAGSTFDASENNAEVEITDGLTLDGTIDLGSASGSNVATMLFQQTQTLAGTGMIQMGGGANNAIETQGSNNDATPATLTIGTGITIDGSSGQIAGYFPADSITNDGMIDATVAGGIITLGTNGTGILTNNGIMEAAAGTLNVGIRTINDGDSPWVNLGTLSLIGAGTLDLNGSFTTSDIGMLNRPGDLGTVDLAGFLNNTAATLTLNAATGSWNLAGGTLTGGTLSDSGGNALVLTSLNGNTNVLAGGVTISSGSTFDASENDAKVAITGGLTLDGTIELGSASGSSVAELLFQGSQTLSGTGVVQLGGGINNFIETQGSNNDATPATLTIGSGITIDGSSGQMAGYFPADSITNDGTIDATVAGGTITLGINGTGIFTNSGITEATNGTLDVGIPTAFSGISPWVNAGTLALIGTGTLNLGGTFTTSAIGTFSRPGDMGTVNLVGQLNNTGATLALNASSGSWNLAGATVTGGTIADSGGALLVVMPSGSTLVGVTIPAGTTVDATETIVTLFITGGLTLDGTLDLGSATNTASVLFDGSQTLSGTGTVQCAAATGGGLADEHGILEPQSQGGIPAVLTIGSGITIEGASEIEAGAAGGTFINQGTINVTDGDFVNLIATGWDNQGTLLATDGADILLRGTFTNEGSLQDPTGLVQLYGSLQNMGQNLLLDGPLFMFGGTIVGGTVTTTGNGNVNAYRGDAGPGDLDAVTLAGTLDSGVAPYTSGDVDITGGLTLQGGAIDLANSGDLQLIGTQTLGGTGTVSLSGIESGFGAFVPDSGDVLTIGSGITVTGDSGQLGSTAGGSLANQGAIEAIGGGTLVVQGDVDFAGGNLSTGAWEAVGDSTLDLIGAMLTTNSAGILLDGASSAIDGNTSGTNALAGLASNGASGNLTLQNGATFTSTGNFSNAGTLTVHAGGTFAVGGSGIFTQTAGSTILDTGILGVAGDQFTIDGGILSGSGSIAGSLTNSGEVDLGASPGVLTVSGNYSQTAAGTLTIKVGGATAGTQFDQLNISGTATLGGTLTAALINGFAPTVEESFPVLTFASSSGNFAKFNSPLVGGSPAFVTDTTPTGLALVGATAAPDLAVAGVTCAPLSASIGQDVTVNYTVDNLGTVATTTGSWTDSVYLSTSSALSADAVLLGRVTHVGNVASLSSYAGTLTAAVPGVLTGNNYVVVVADSGDVVADVNRANNMGADATPLPVAVPLLTVGVATSGAISNGQDIYYRLNVTPGSNVQVQATFAVSDEADEFVRFGALPTTSSFDESSTDASDLKPVIVLPGGQGGAYYILLQGRDGAGAGQSYSLLASVVPFEVSSFSPSSGSNQGGNFTITLTGSGFTPLTTVTLQNGGGTIAAASISPINSNTLEATFDLTGQPTGNYSVVATNGSQSTSGPGSFQVNSESANSNLNVFLAVQPSAPPGVPLFQAAGVTNAGNSDAQVPEYLLVATNVDGYTLLTQGIGGITLGPGGITGEHGYFYPTGDTIGATSTWTIMTAPPTETVDWSSLDAYRPADISSAAWDAIVSNLSTNIGSTYSDLDTAFQADSTYLAQLGESVTDQSSLMDFEVEKAADLSVDSIPSSVTDSDVTEPGISLEFERSFVNTIPGRNELGLLGYGWTTNWDISATTDSSGNVFIQEGSNTREFAPQSNGSYVGENGDAGILTLSKGAYTLTDPDGTVTSFLPNGQLNYQEDADGNRITAGYNAAGEMITLTHSDGQVLTLAYNSQGLVSQITDPAGNATSYSYDSNKQLIGVSGPSGSYQYTYVNGKGAPSEHALASITSPNGVQESFTYDSEGRLINQSEPGGADSLTYTYLSPDGYTVTDASGATTTVLVNDDVVPAYIKDASGNVYTVSYNANGQPILKSLPGGTAFSTTYNSNGTIATETDALGNTTQFTTNPQTEELQSLEDADGNTTSFSYNSQGLLSSILGANGATSDFVYNAQGEIVQSTDALGRITNFTYNSLGELIQQDNPDGTSATYGYNSAGDITSASDSSGTILISYNAAGDIAETTYPNGQFIKYTYTSGGQLAQLSDQSGFTENYSYNSLGQLAEVTDSSGAMVVSYTYNLDGQMSSEAHGNGTYTTYAYNSNGELTHLINFAPDSSINSRFDYTYDALGDVTSVVTLTGTTTYSYDADRRLTSVTLPTGETITYGYDAMGNRTVVSNSGGTTTDYVANNVNEYTSVGGYTYTYDADGDLTVSGGPAGSTTYTYDTENRLIRVQTPTDIETFTYDALGNLISSTDNGQVTQYLVDPTGLGNVIAEYDGSGNLIANFTYGDGLVSQVGPSGSALYYDFDNTGSTVGLSGASGSYVDTYTYLPFGEVQSSTGSVANPFQYNGQGGVITQANGLDFMRSRFYSPAIGRFLTSDPAGLKGGLNLYTFASNNPLSFQDPSGLVPGLNPNSYSLGIGLVRQYAGELSSYLLGDTSYAALSGGSLGVGGTIAVYAALGLIDIGIIGLVGYELYGLYNDLNVPVVNGADPSQQATIASASATIVGPQDPNFDLGPSGYGPQGFVPGDGEMPYTIGFENEPTATAPAHVVEVTEQIDPNLDWTTFQLGDFGVGGVTYSVPAGLSSYSTRIDDTAEGVYVDVDANFDELTGLLTWTFTSIDPITLDDPVGNFDEGFLPPDEDAPDGQGWVSYTVSPKSNDPTGTVINSQATVIFDAGLSDQSPLDTNSIFNTIDSGAPTSAVGALPATETNPNFLVSWSGQDDSGGSGIAYYNIYVSDNGGAFIPFLQYTTQTSATFSGQVGHAYSFYSVAVDNVGNEQATPPSAQASTTVVSPISTTSLSNLTAPASLTYGTASQTFSGVISAGSLYPPAGETVSVTLNGVTQNAIIAANGAFSITFNTSTLPASATPYGVTYAYAGDANFTAASNTTATTLTVSAATATLSFSGHLNPTYNGLGQSLSVTTSPTGLAGVTITYSQAGSPVTSPTDAGTYQAAASLSNPNYVAAPIQATLVIEQATPAFTNLSAPSTIAFGTTTTSFSGTISAGTIYPPAGEIVAITLNDATQDAIIGADGSFLGTFDTATLPVSVTPYAVTYDYGGDTNFAGASNDSTTTLTVSGATAILSFTGNLNPTYNGTSQSVEVVTSPANLSGVSIVYSQGGTPVISPINAGTYQVVASLNNPNYTAAPIETTLVVSPATPAFSSLSTPSSIGYGTASVTFSGVISAGMLYPPGGETVTVTLNGTTQNASIGSAGAFKTTFNTATLPASTTPYPITYSYAGDNNFSSASNNSVTTLLVGKATATVMLSNLIQTYTGAAEFVSVATVPAGLNVVVSYTQGGITVDSPTNAGSYSVTATVSNPDYQATATGTLVISPASQTISFGSLASVSYGMPPITLTATSSSGLPVSFSIVSGPATLTSNSLTITGAGTIVIAASQSGNGNYQPAPTVQQELIVTPATATLSFSGNLNVTYDGAPQTVSVTTSPANLSGIVITYNQGGNPVVNPINAGTYQVTASLNNPNYTATQITETLTIAKATPVFTNLTAPASIASGTASVTFSGVISAGGVYPPSGETVAVTLIGVTQNAAIGTSGAFSTTFNTSALPASTTPYAVTYTYAGDTNFVGASNSTTTTLTITPATSTEKLVFLIEPWNSPAGILPPVIVLVENNKGQLVLSDNSQVTLSIASGPGMLGGTTTAKTILGIAVFADLSITKAGVYTLIAADGSDTSVVSSPFTITPAAPAKLVFTEQPETTIAGKTLNPVVVDVEDRYGNVVTADNSVVSVSIATGPPEGQLNGTRTAHVIDGTAVFSNLSPTIAGTYQLLASDSILPATALSDSFIIIPAAAARMAFITVPSAIDAGQAFTVQLVLLDQYGNIAANDNSTVTLSLNTHPKNAVLSGILSTKVVSGIATFSDLIVNVPGSYSLLATDALSTALSPLFYLSPSA